MATKNTQIMPKSVTLNTWIEDFDLRTLRRKAYLLCHQHNIKSGEAALVSGSYYKGGRRFAFLVNTDHGPLVMQPQTGSQSMLLSMMIRVHEYAQLAFEV